MANHDPLDVVRSIIDRYPGVMAVLHEATLLGWEAAARDMQEMTRAPTPLRLRTRRSIANDYVVGFAPQLLEPIERAGGLKWVDEAETLTLRLDPHYAVRVKKTDRTGRPSNIPTSRQRRIGQSGQLVLFGIAEGDLLSDDGLLWLTVGYIPDELDERIELVGLTLGDGSVGLHALDRPDDGALAQLAPECWPLILEARRRLA